MTNGSQYSLASNPTGEYLAYFNGTVTLASEIFNCTMYDEGIGAIELFTDINISQDNLFNWSFTGEERQYKFNLSCVNSNTSDALTDYVWVYFDGINPVITTQFQNNSVYHRNLSNSIITFNTTFSDTNLFAVNITLWNSTAGVVFQHFIENLTTSPYENTTNITLNSLPPGNYTYIQEVWDDHTKQDNIKPVQWFYKPDAIIIDNDITISGAIKEDLTTFKLSPTGEKYKFKITFKGDSTHHEFEIETSGDLYFRPASEYLGHFAYLQGNRWIDLVNDNIKSVDVVEISPNRYSVSIDLYKSSDEIEFESIGDLNYQSQRSYFNVSQASTIFAIHADDNSSITDFTALIYNSTYNETRIGTGGVAYTNLSGVYSVNVTATSYIDNSTPNLTFSSGSSHNIYLDLSEALRFYVYDEELDTLITWENVTIEVINYDNESFRYNTSTGTKYVSGFAVGDYEIRYYADNYGSRLYYTTISSLSTQTIDLYLLNSSTGTIKLTEIVNQNAEGLANATLKMTRHFISCNCFKIVEMAKTDAQGNTFIFAELYTAPYRFLIDYQGVTKLSSDTFRLDSRDLYFKVNLLDSGLSNYWDSIGVSSTLTGNTTAHLWDYTWSDANNGVTQANLVVKRITSTDTTTIANVSLAASAGSLTFNQSAYATLDGEFVAEGYVTIGGEDYLVEKKSYNYETTYLDFGLSGVILATIAMLVVMAVGLFNPSVAVIAMVLGMIITIKIGILEVSAVWAIGMVISAFVLVAKLKT